MHRRSFIGSILALAAAPAIVRADSLMRVVPIDTTIIGLDLASAPDLSAVYLADLGERWAGRVVEIMYSRCNPRIVIEREYTNLFLLGAGKVNTFTGARLSALVDMQRPPEVGDTFAII